MMASLANKHLPYESKARLAGHVASGTRMTEAELVSATPVDKHSLRVRLSPFSTRVRRASWWTATLQLKQPACARQLTIPQCAHAVPAACLLHCPSQCRTCSSFPHAHA
jgi:hypothetical protein